MGPLAVLVLAAMIFWLFFIKKWRSNFIYYFQNANKAVKPDVKLKIALSGRNKMNRALYPANVFMTPWNRSNLWLEMIHIKKCSDHYEALFRICKPSCAAKEKINLQTHLDLYFEGKFVGNAEVIETFGYDDSSGII